jgi:hypothetical protein
MFLYGKLKMLPNEKLTDLQILTFVLTLLKKFETPFSFVRNSQLYPYQNKELLLFLVVVVLNTEHEHFKTV